MDGQSGSTPITTPTQKKSRFNRPKWAAKPQHDSVKADNDSDPFSRKTETEAILRHEQERIAKLRAEEEARSREKPVKRRKLNSESPTGSGSDSGRPGRGYMDTKIGSAIKSANRTPQKPSPALRQNGGGSSSKKNPEYKSRIIDLVDTDEDEEQPTPLSQRSMHRAVDEYPFQRRVVPDEPLFPVVDDEELYSKPAPQSKAKALTPPPADDDQIDTTPVKLVRTAAQIAAEDTRVQLLIWSEIPDTEPLLVARKIGQRLLEVKKAWVDRQDLPDDLKREIVLTWRGQKLYDFATCANLGITANEFGEVKWKGVDLVEENGAQVVFLATTPKAMEEEKRRAEAAKKGKLQAGNGAGDGAGGAEEGNAAASGQQDAKAGAEGGSIRVVIRGNLRELKEYKLKVRPVTKFKQIVDAFRKINNIDDAKQVYLMFDGERLEENDDMATLEDFAEGEYLDAMVK